MSKKEIDIQATAKQILAELSGADNILDVTNCMTRLRLRLKKIDDDTIDNLKKIPGVLGVNLNGEELQIILGPGRVTKVREAFEKLITEVKTDTNSTASFGSEKAAELHSQIKAKNATPFKLLLKKIANIFMPLIPGFVGCGLITGILGVILKFNPDMASYAWIKMMIVIGNAVFFGMNLMVGLNAAKEFGATPVIGGCLAAVITHPMLKDIVLWDENLVPGRGGIIAVVMVAVLGAFIEKKLKKIIPEMFSIFFIPLITLLICGFAAFFIIQPLGGYISNIIGNGATFAVEQGGILAGMILAGTWLPVVMMGIHQAFTPIHAELISRSGETILLPILAMAGAGQVGASAAVYFKTKNQQLKKTIASALPIGLMGIGEPLIYGVTLPLGKPFIAACIGAAFGGAVQAYFTIGSYGMGISGLPLAAITSNIPMYLLGLVVAYICGFVACWLIGFDDPEL